MPLISACRAALKAKQVEIDEGNAALTLSALQVKTLTEQRNDAEGKLNSWTRNPWIYFGLGAIAVGVILRR